MGKTWTCNYCDTSNETTTGICNYCGIVTEIKSNTEFNQSTEVSGTGNVSIRLIDAGSKKISVIKEVREATGLGLKEAKDLVDNTPSLIKSNISHNEAVMITNKIKSVGGVTDLI